MNLSNRGIGRRIKSSTYADIIRRVNNFAGADLTTLSDSEIDQRIGRIIDDHRMLPLHCDIGVVFRARINKSGSSFENTRDLWCPPDSVVNLGRFNRKGESVFYASNLINAAFWEVRPAVGNVVTVAICAPINGVARLHLNHIGLYNFSGFISGVIPDIRTNPGFMRLLSNHGISSRWRRVDAFFADLSKSNASFRPDLYRATSQIGHIFTKIPGVDGLAYPSVASGMAAINYRIHRLAAQRDFQIKEVWEFEIEGHFPGSCAITPDPGKLITKAIRRSHSIDIDGGIRWLPDGMDVSPEHLKGIPSRVGSVWGI